MKLHSFFLVCCTFISACSNSIYNVNSKGAVLTVDNFSKNEKLINKIIETPLSREVYYYSSPDSTLNSSGTIPPNTEIRTLSRNGHWYKINYKDSTPFFVLVSMMHYQGQSIYQRKPFDTTNPVNTPDNGSQLIQTGPRGGRYYINSNGNKIYMKHK